MKLIDGVVKYRIIIIDEVIATMDFSFFLSFFFFFSLDKVLELRRSQGIWVVQFKLLFFVLLQHSM